MMPSNANAGSDKHLLLAGRCRRIMINKLASGGKIILLLRSGCYVLYCYLPVFFAVPAVAVCCNGPPIMSFLFVRVAMCI